MDGPVRCKFVCNSVKKYFTYTTEGKKFLYNYEFSVVTSGSEENKSFFESTPSGSLNVAGVRGDLFAPGREYYLDLSIAG